MSAQVLRGTVPGRCLATFIHMGTLGGGLLIRVVRVSGLEITKLCVCGVGGGQEKINRKEESRCR